jgi:hypothetical protein
MAQSIPLESNSFLEPMIKDKSHNIFSCSHISPVVGAYIGFLLENFYEKI